MLDAAMRLMQAGLIPSITDVAEAAQVSRATAYRYFPTQSALIQAAVGEALGPILKWDSDFPDAEQRVRDLIAFAYPRMDEYEAPLRAALRLSLDQWAQLHAGALAPGERMVRGHRIHLLSSAIDPLTTQAGQSARAAADASAELGVRHRGLRGAEGHLGPGPCGRGESGAMDLPGVDPQRGRGTGATGAAVRAERKGQDATARPPHCADLDRAT